MKPLSNSNSKNVTKSLNINAKPFIPKSRQIPIIAQVFVEKSEIKQDEEQEFCVECKDCKCCKGFIYNCAGVVCKDLGMCHCKSAMETMQLINN